MMSMNFAAKLLAHVYVMGGGNEGLNAGIAIAQQKFHIKGGETPMIKSIPVIRSFIHELERLGDETPWLQQIYSRYNMTHNKSKNKK